MRRTWLQGPDNVAKRYLIHVAGHNLGLLMRTLLGAGTPRAAAEIRLFWLLAGDRVVLALLASPMSRSTTAGAATPAFAIISVTPDDRSLSTAW